MSTEAEYDRRVMQFRKEEAEREYVIDHDEEGFPILHPGIPSPGLMRAECDALAAWMEKNR